MLSQYIIDGLGIFVGGAMAVIGAILVDIKWLKATLIVVGTAIFFAAVIIPLEKLGISWWSPIYLGGL